jgi:hypothetical protein
MTATKNTLSDLVKVLELAVAEADEADRKSQVAQSAAVAAEKVYDEAAARVVTARTQVNEAINAMLPQRTTSRVRSS